MELSTSINYRALAICAVLMALIFAIDLQLPLGVAGGVPYVAVILVSLWIHDTRFVIIFAVLCSLLTLLGFFFSPYGGELWKVMANRALALFVIWITALLIIRWNDTYRQLLQVNHEREKEQEKLGIYYATIHGVQHITYNLLNQLQLVQLEIQGQEDFDQDVAGMFNEMLSDADAMVKDLSSVKQIDAENIIQSVHQDRSGWRD